MNILNTILSGASAVKGALQKFQALTGGLLSIPQLKQLAIDAVPRPIEGIVLSSAIYISSLIALIVAHVQPILDEFSAVGGALQGAFPALHNAITVAQPPVTLLVNIKTSLDEAIAKKAGSEVLKAAPSIFALVQSFVTTESSAVNVAVQADLPTRAIAAHVAMVQVSTRFEPPAEPEAPIEPTDTTPDIANTDGSII